MKKRIQLLAGDKAGQSVVIDTDDSEPASDNLLYVDLYCEYPQCDNEFHGDDIEIAIKRGWQHGYDASFCPDHNV